VPIAVGQRFLERLDAAMAEVDKAVFAPLNEAERADLDALLGKAGAQLP
jgi:hypothetical protein